jgi:uncharacterized protein (DUF2147 family)
LIGKTMFYRLSAYAIAAALLPVSPVAAEEAFPNGVWSDARRRIIVRVAPCGVAANSFCGTVVRDNRRGRPTNPPGHLLIRHLSPSRPNWTGQVMDVGTKINMTLRPIANDRAMAQVCMIGLFCLSETVVRIDANEEVAMLERR